MKPKHADKYPKHAEEVARICSGMYPNYKKPLDDGNKLLLAGDGGPWAALDVFEFVRAEFPNELKVRERLILALLATGDHVEAKHEVQVVEGKDFRWNDDEETLCRIGRLHRDLAENAFLRGDLTAAGAEFNAAQKFYEQAYGRRSGHYPGINLAAMYLLRASVSEAVQRPALLADAARVANELLAARPNWPKDYNDDNVWHRATEADAQFLAQRWAEAEATYEAVLVEPGLQPFHRESVFNQLARLLRAYRTCGVEDQNSFQRFEELIKKAIPPVTPPNPPASN